MRSQSKISWKVGHHVLPQSLRKIQLEWNTKISSIYNVINMKLTTRTTKLQNLESISAATAFFTWHRTDTSAQHRKVCNKVVSVLEKNIQFSKPSLVQNVLLSSRKWRRYKWWPKENFFLLASSRTKLTARISSILHFSDWQWRSRYSKQMILSELVLIQAHRSPWSKNNRQRHVVAITAKSFNLSF